MQKLTLKLKTLTLAFLLMLNLVSPVVALAETTPTSPSTPAAPTTPATPTTPTTTTPAPDPTIIPVTDPTVTTPVVTEPVVQVTGDTQAPTSQTTNNNDDGSRRRHRGSNRGNGGNSTNNTTQTDTSTTDVTTANNADVNNVVNVTGDTGDNSASKNMGDGVVNSGDSSTAAALMNDINNNTITIGDLCGLGCSSGFVEENLKNGNGTLNNADGSLTRAVILNNANNLNLTNTANLASSTGGNTADKNMGDGTITTGDADVSFTTINMGNNNYINPSVVTFNIVDDQSEDLWINFPAGTGGSSNTGFNTSNVGNGAGSMNDSDVSSTSTTSMDSQNNLVLDNNVTIYANTGNNTANKNMGSGNITTGDANIVSNIVNFLNNTFVAGTEFLIGNVNIFGNMSGNIILPREADLSSCGCASDYTLANTGNGADSENINSSEITDTTTINQDNNANVNNNLNLEANTGGNTAEKNMGNTTITTGDVDASSNLVTVANTNTVGGGDTWWLVIVNNQGKYEGHIVGAEDGAMIDGSGLDFGINPDGSVYSLNSGNGADSNNNANTASNTSTTINQTNNATINNNVNIVANTGDNQADKNMEGANIQTGNVNVASNIVNFVNNNFVGKKLMLVFVNVFGSFTGSIVPPDQEIPAGNGGSSSQDSVTSSVNLPSGTTLSSNSNTSNKVKKTSYLTGSVSGVTNTINQAFQDTGKILEDGLSTTQNPVTKVIDASHTKSGFSMNFVLIGLALLVVSGYAFYMKRRSN